MTSHQAQGFREVRWAAGEIHERADDTEVEAAGIDLAHDIQRGRKAKIGDDLLVQRSGLGGIAIEEADLVKTSAHGTFQATGGIGAKHRFELAEAAEHFLAKHGDALAECSHLCSHVVRARGEGNIADLRGALGELHQHSHAFGPDQL